MKKYCIAIFGFLTGMTCPVYSVTGFLCPGCGVTRAAAALLRFDIMQAIYYHPFFVAAIPVGLYFAVRFCCELLRRRVYRISRWERRFLIFFAAAAILYVILRNFIDIPFFYTR